MKPLSVLTALVVALALYALVFERDRLVGLAGGGDDAPTSRAEQAAPAAGEAAAGEGALPAQAAELQPVRVAVIDSRTRRIDTTVAIRGQTQAARQVDVRAETSGLIVSDPIRAGAEVAQDQVLCELDPSTRPAALAEAEASLAEAQINATAAERLAEGGFGSQTARAQARAALQAAEAAVELARTEIDRLAITAPFAGFLEADTAEFGSFLQTGSTCATVLQLNPMKLVAYIPETLVEDIAIGAQARARLASGRDVAGEVSFLSRSADPDTRTFRVEITVDNSDNRIRDGQSADITLTTDGVSAHLVPGSALTLDDSGRMGLRVVDADDRAAFYPVTIVRDAAEGIFVSGLPDRSRIVVTGQEYITEGTPLDPVLQEAAG